MGRSKWEIMIDEGEKILIRRNFISAQFTALYTYLKNSMLLYTFRISKNMMGFPPGFVYQGS